MLDPKQTKKQGGGSPLKKIRQALELTQEQLAQKLGTSVFRLSRMERGVFQTSFSLREIQILQSELEAKGLSFSNFPDLSEFEESTESDQN